MTDGGLAALGKTELMTRTGDKGGGTRGLAQRPADFDPCSAQLIKSLEQAIKVVNDSP